MSATHDRKAQIVGLAILAAIANDDPSGADELTADLDTDQLRAMVVAAWTAFINEMDRHHPARKEVFANAARQMIAERILDQTP